MPLHTSLPAHHTFILLGVLFTPGSVGLCLILLFTRSVLSNSLWSRGLQHARLPITISWSLLKLMSIESVVPSNHLIFCCPLLLLPSIFPSIRVFSSELALHIRWPTYWSFSFSISPSKEYSGFISLLSNGLLRAFFNTTVQKHKFFGTLPPL